ncbi:unhealthy ribosome biogenesis protein 2 homolog isoform X1 [Electrophorus electricus]|uniref:unhealthy ribosome biogenesis protein 2 homolog isoform X1 n=1 Tax=Electrophorus electricus TaxID=8005 RepID=UPI0015D05EA9|nr:unhealthy ribosome biogenesis protein 2 homolog isoform X1 [Electrophorus electricus]
MATIYSGFHVKLKSPLTPWSDRLKLARFAWTSRQCFLPNKEQVLFDWVSHALSCYYNKKVQVPLEVVEDLWTYLDEILHSKKLYNVLNQGKTITLNPSLAKIINERILESTSGTLPVSLSIILSCCHGILTSPVLSVTYTASYELLVKLLATVCGLACFQLKQQGSPEPLQLKVFEVLFLVLNTYLTVQRQQGNANRVFAQVTEHLFLPLCLLRHLLTTRVWTEVDDTRIRQQLKKDIRNKVDTILQSALFHSDHLSSYKEVLPSENKSGARKEPRGKPLLCPVSTIVSKLVHKYGDDNEALFYAVRSSSLPLLFKMALDSFCKREENKLLCFHFMTKLITALEFTEDLSVKETFKAANWSLALLALENILNCCLSADVYNVAADRIHHREVQFNFFRKVAKLLLNNTQTGIPAWYRCLKNLLALNHQILEPDLDELISSVWVDADNMELRVKKARETLVSEILQTYSKLRQLPRLIEELLGVIDRPAAYELRQALLPQVVQKSLSQCLLNNPPRQNLEICMLILEKMQNELPYVAEMREASALKLFSLGILLHAVIFSLKALDDSTPVPIVRQTQSLMENMLTFLRALLQNLEETLIKDSICGEKIQETSLLLTHTWHEADALFQIHCSKYTSSAGLSNDVSPVSDAIEKVLTLTGSGVQVISPLSKLLQKHLALHKMKKHLLIANANTQNILCETAQYVVNRQEHLLNLNMDQIWDLQLCSVDSDTYPVACWFLIITNLPLIAPYLSQEDASHIADMILNSVLQSNTGSNMEKTDQSISNISRQLLESVVLCELPHVHSAVVTSINKRIFGLLSASDVHSVCPSFFRSCTEMDVSENKEEGIAEISPSLKRLKAMAQEIIDSVKTGTSISVSDTQVGSLLRLIKITNALNPYAMPLESYLELFLSSFLMSLCVQHHENGACSAPISLLKELFDIMAFLVGSNSHHVLKVVHGSTLLETAMMSLFSSLRKGLFGSVDISVWFSLLQSVQGFIQSLIHLIIIRKSSVQINLEKFTNFMVESTVAVGSSANSGKCEETQCLIELHLATLSTLCKEIISIFGEKKYLNEIMSELLGKAVFIMVPTIQSVMKGTAGSIIRLSFTVDVVTVMIKCELAKASLHTEGVANEDAQDKLSHTGGLYKSFGQQIMKEFCSAPQPMDFLISSIHYLSAFYSAAITTKETDLEDLYSEILKSIHKLLSSVWLSISEVKELEAPVKDLLAQLVVNCSQEQFRLLLLMFQEGLVATKVERGYYRDVLATVALIKLLAGCPLPLTCSKAFWAIVPQIISSLVFVVRESREVATLTSSLIVPVVDTLTTLLRQGESWLSNPHNIILVLGALHFVPLENQSMEDYYSAFQAIHEALFAIILCYPKIMLKSAPTFLNCFYRLVTSIIHEGKQKGMNEKEKDSEKLLKCARLVERMYTHIGKTAEGFSILSSFMVAQYVNELQKVTLRPEIKAHLTEGIYCILDQCIENDIKFLNRTLQKGLKEVFDELYKNYTRYHKSQWQGEEKYTA